MTLRGSLSSDCPERRLTKGGTCALCGRPTRNGWWREVLARAFPVPRREEMPARAGHRAAASFREPRHKGRQSRRATIALPQVEGLCERRRPRGLSPFVRGVATRGATVHFGPSTACVVRGRGHRRLVWPTEPRRAEEPERWDTAEQGKRPRSPTDTKPAGRAEHLAHPFGPTQSADAPQKGYTQCVKMRHIQITW